MSCEVAALPFRAHANYGTMSIDFGPYIDKGHIKCGSLISLLGTSYFFLMHSSNISLTA